MSVEFTKDELLHMHIAIVAVGYAGECEHCDSAAKKIQNELARLYELPAVRVSTLLEIPEEYKKLGVVEWELIKAKGEGDVH